MKWVHLLLLGTLVLHFLVSHTSFCITVTGAEPGPGVGSSEDSDVFVCEAAIDTPAPVSNAVSELPGESSKRGRTQHARAAVGVEASVVYNDWEKGTLKFSCSLYCLCHLRVVRFLCVVV